MIFFSTALKAPPLPPSQSSMKTYAGNGRVRNYTHTVNYTRWSVLWTSSPNLEINKMATDCCFVGSEAIAAASVFLSSATDHDSLPLQLSEHYEQTLLLRFIILITVCLFHFISFCYSSSPSSWSENFSSRRLGASHSHRDSGSELAGETQHIPSPRSITNRVGSFASSAGFLTRQELTNDI